MTARDPEVSLTRAGLEARALVLAMARDFHAEDGHPLTPGGEAALERVLAGEPMAALFLIRVRDTLAGYAVLTRGFSIEFGGPDAFLDDFYVLPGLRGNGIGTRALALLDDAARVLGAGTLHLAVEPQNDRVIALYVRHGYHQRGLRLLSKPLHTG